MPILNHANTYFFAMTKMSSHAVQFAVHAEYFSSYCIHFYLKFIIHIFWPFCEYVKYLCLLKLNVSIKIQQNLT